MAIYSGDDILRAASTINPDGTGGGGASSVTINDPTVTTQKLKVNADGSINVNSSATVTLGEVEVKNDTGNPIPTNILTTIQDYVPAYDLSDGGSQNLATDPDGNLLVRGGVTTDARSFRCNFSGTSLLSTIGTCNFTNGSTTVTGTNFGTYDIHIGNYVKLDSDTEDKLVQVETQSYKQTYLMN